MSEEEKKTTKKVARRRTTQPVVEENKETSYSSLIEDNSGTLGIINNYAGQFVSLNMKATTYFGLGHSESGENKMWLSPTNWFDKIPDNLTDEEAILLSKGIQEGKLVVGKKWIPAIDKDKTVKARYVTLLREYRAPTEKFKDEIRALVLNKKEGNYTSTEIIRAMLAAENGGAARPDFLVFLNDAHAHCAGPVSLVEDFPSDPDNYIVTVDPQTMVVTSHTRRAKPDDEVSAAAELAAPYGQPVLDDPVERANKIDNALD